MSNVQDEILFAANNLGRSKENMVRELAIHAEKYQVKELLDKDVAYLSSGEKQRVAIAAATFLKPKLLILDEPTANLDPKTMQLLTATLIKLKQDGTTIVISDHRLFSYRQLADRFIVLNKGQVVLDLHAEQFLALSNEMYHQYGLRYPTMGMNNLLEKVKQEAPNSLQIKDLQYVYKKVKRAFSIFRHRFRVEG